MIVLLGSSDAGFGCALLAATVVAILYFVIWYSKTKNDRREVVLEGLADRHHGRVYPGGLWNLPRLEFRAEGVDAEVDYWDSSRNKSWTRIRFNYRFDSRLRITPQGFSKWLRSLVSGADLEVGDPTFDRMFWIEAADPAWAREILSPEVRDRFFRLLRLEKWMNANDITLDLGPAGMMLRVNRILLDDVALLEKFVDLAILVLERARGIMAVSGVAIAKVVVGGGACPVCGHAVVQGKTCPDCRTPHHLDCWKYSGGCAIFGCRSRKSDAA